MTLERFNTAIIELANKVGAIRKYSYSRRGLKFDIRNPNKMLSSCEAQRVEAIEQKMNDAILTFASQKS